MRAPIIALVAGVWTLARVDALMYSEIAFGCASIFTLVAGVRTLTGMCALV